jgi:hypothetical protein
MMCGSRLLKFPYKRLKKRKDCRKTEKNGELSHRLIQKGNGIDKVEKVDLLNSTSAGFGIQKFSAFYRGQTLSKPGCVI